jgi:hypothetical protein
MNKVAKYFICFLLTEVTTLSVYAQNPVVGRVVDKETGKPIKEAVVTWTGTDVKATSNAMGYFQLQIDSTASIEITGTDYLPMKVKILEPKNFKIELVKAKALEKKVYKIFEQPPSFPGGYGELLRYINNNIKLPKEVKRGSITGQVNVEFVIDSTGSIPPDEVKVKEGLCIPCDEEALRLIKGLPKWNPGIQLDKPVNVRMVLPVMFK